MSRRKAIPLSFQIAAEGLDALECREALYLRLLDALQAKPNSPVVQNLHRRLCEVRAALFSLPA